MNVICVILLAVLSMDVSALISRRSANTDHRIVRRQAGGTCTDNTNYAIALDEEVDVVAPSPRVECMWHLSAPQGAQVILVITRVGLDPEDQLLVYDHPSSTDNQYLTAAFRGRARFRISDLISSRGGLTVHYLPGANARNFEAFALVDTVVEPLANADKGACGGKISFPDADSTVKLYAPYSRAAGFRSRRPFGGATKTGTVSCMWAVEAPAGQKIQVTWDNVQTIDVSVGIYDHRTISPANEVTRIEGTIDWDIAPFVSTGNTIVLYLRQDQLARTIGDGFQATLAVVGAEQPVPQSSCGGSIPISETATRISSPYYDEVETAESIIQCWWFLTAPPNTQIRLNIADLDTTQSEDVTISEGTAPDGAVLVVLTGQVPDRNPVYSRTNAVRIYLNDDAVAGPNGRGFLIEALVAETGYSEAQGDPHYLTFDGLRYDFQGDCEYTMVTPCRPLPDGTPTFNLWGNNIISTWNNRVSVLREVTLDYNGTSFFIGQGRELRVDGVIVPPPVQKNGVSISFAHPLLIVDTDFGLRFSYDGAYFLRIWISALYRDNTCGLSGTFDGDRTNDFTLRNGSVTSDVNLFGFDWSIDKETCQKTEPLDENPCNNDDNLNQQVTETCSVFDPRHARGNAFADCFELVDPQRFYDSCMYDLCYTHPQNKVICASVEEFVLLCQQANQDVVIGNWRDLIAQCVFECPEGKVYQACGTTCPNTCTDLRASLTCDTCRETCACPEGQVLDGENCVSPENCGCSLPNGLYITGGSTWVSDTCDQRCNCIAGVLECTDTRCGENFVCAVQNGVRGCYCQGNFVVNGEGECVPGPGTCSISGDPHYYTFDGGVHHFQGDCLYTLVKPCSPSDDLQAFHIWGDNEKNNPSATVSYLRRVFIEVNGTTYSLGQGKAFTVNGVATPNANYNDGVVHVWTDSVYITLETSFGVRIQYDGWSSGIFQVPPQYWNNTCGLCGTFDYNPSNEFTTADGVVTNDVNAFGMSWETGSDECNHSVGPANPCEVSQAALEAAQAACRGLINPDGPFRACQDFVDAGTYYESCVYDACVIGSRDPIICSSYEQYAAACQQIEQTVGDWRAGLDQCAFTCPEPQIYQACGTACPATCADPAAADTCSLPCRETCICPDGLLLDGGRCVSRVECGCQFNGVYYSDGQEWLTDDCSQKCACVSREAVCTPNSCRATEECSLSKHGVRGCYCQDGFRRNDTICIGDVSLFPFTEYSVICSRTAVTLYVNDVAFTEPINVNLFAPGSDEVCVVFRQAGNLFYFTVQVGSCREILANPDWSFGGGDSEITNAIELSSVSSSDAVALMGIRSQTVCQYARDDYVPGRQVA